MKNPNLSVEIAPAVNVISAEEMNTRMMEQAAHSGEIAVGQTVSMAYQVKEHNNGANLHDQSFEGGTYDYLFEDSSNDTWDSLTDDERRQVTNQLIEKAAVRNPKLFELIGTAPRDSTGNYIFDEQSSKELIQSLKEYGIETGSLSDETIAHGVQEARDIVERGDAIVFLQGDTKFIDNSQMRRLRGDNPKDYRLDLKAVGMIDPYLIKGVEGFDSWAGRGHNGGGEVAVRDGNTGLSTRSSIAQISDYATRDTQLPRMDFLALDLILTDDGPVYYATNAHRVAAARLRGEKLRFDSINITDARSK